MNPDLLLGVRERDAICGLAARDVLRFGAELQLAAKISLKQLCFRVGVRLGAH
jgi:hypothetical protein